jgi:3-hydroxyisobutyrate dehydrogenase-like beta-hydroxyacid dehydrogenase
MPPANRKARGPATRVNRLLLPPLTLLPARAIVEIEPSDGDGYGGPSAQVRDQKREVSEMGPIGFVGLGAMGSQMAGRLLDSGYAVYGTNRTRSKAQGLIDRGLRWRDTSREVADAADVTFSMVTDDAALDAITSGPDGVLAGLAAGKVYVDMSTVSPHVSTALAARVEATGAAMVDAPVSGSIPQVQAGTLAIMVGGTHEAFATVEPVLRVLGQTVTHVGANGHGLVLKLAINISLAAQTLAFSEGLLLAERGGIDPHLAAEVMSTSSIGSPMLKARVPLILDLPEHAWFDVAMMHKDIRLARRTADELEITLPSAKVVDETLTLAGELGYEHRDLASLYEVLETSSARNRHPSPRPSQTDRRRT